MSVQDGERLATKQDLADMYQGILPYLGGMPEVVANKFSKGDIYSTSEKMIGQWQDGRPLYQKYITFTGLDIGLTAGAWTNITSVSDLDIRSLVSIEFPSLRTCPCFYRVNSGYLQYYSDTQYYNYSNGSAIIRYTKTTDTAISIGEVTDYSTTEKIVGTWLSGEPVYQQVITMDSYVSLGATKGTWTNICEVPNVTNANLIHCEFMNGGTLRKPPIFYRINGGYLQYFDNFVSGSSTTAISFENFTTNCVIIQYTKTT